MTNSFEKVRNYLLDLNYVISRENEKDGIFIIDNETSGIKNMMLDCVDPILVMEQYIMEVSEGSAEMYKKLLQKNRDIIHGSFALDNSGKRLLFRDTLQLDSLDINELEASLNSLSLLLGEYSDELIKFSKS